MDQRLQQLNLWLQNTIGLSNYDLTPASEDASFRRYFRVSTGSIQRIVMDAPPEKEDSRPFIRVSRLFSDLGLNVPKVLAEDLTQGFLLLTDLGQECYLPRLDPITVDSLYTDAMQALFTLQRYWPRSDILPYYDRTLLMEEMELFQTWYLEQHLHIVFNPDQNAVLDEVYELLATSALQQPQVCVHRDYHSRNLLVCDQNPGILDFQDAVIGPVTYDLVSLLRDCYITWPNQQVADWVIDYQKLALDAGIITEPDSAQFMRWFDLMGIQRHLKVLGIFSRLNYRDNKEGYLNEIPRIINYVKDVSTKYEELSAFHRLICDLPNDSKPCT